MRCNIFKDLLPLYFDGLCSDETKKQLEEHMGNCKECRELAQDLKPAQEWSDKEGWDKSITPLKKVKKKIFRKNIYIAVCIFFLLVFTGAVSVLTYGQIAKKWVSFELIHDALKMPNIGKQFAAGNIEPLYAVLSNGYILQDEESGIVRSVYSDEDTYNNDMKETILSKYHKYFDDKHLKYKGIEEICYLETVRMGWNRTLYISLKFEGIDGTNKFEYYIGLYKTLGGKYIVQDYFGNPYLSYVSDNKEGKTKRTESESGNLSDYHTEDSLFSSLPNRLGDADLCMARQMVLVSGKRALNGDTVLTENGQMRLWVMSEQDLSDGTNNLQNEINDKLKEAENVGYYLTDITWTANEYDKVKHLYKYRIGMELTNKTNSDKAVIIADCYRILNKFIYIPGTDKIYAGNFPNETAHILEKMYE